MEKEACCRGVDAAQEMIKDHVNRGKWGVISVMGGPEPGFAYTVGLHHKGLPEIIMVGLSAEVSMVLLNDCAARMIEQNEAFVHGTEVDGIANMPLTLIDVTDDRKREYAIQAFNHYRHWDFKLQQMVMPDAKGVFPWEVNFDKKMEGIQTVLGNFIDTVH